MANKITIDRGVITIFPSHNSNSGGYQVRVANAGDIENDGGNTSELILQIQDKTWIQKETLYQLAQLINKHCPGNKIDWVATFLIVEKTSYLDHVKEIKQALSPKKDKESLSDQFKTTLGDITSAREDAMNPEIQKTIRDIVTDNLKKYKLI